MKIAGHILFVALIFITALSTPTFAESYFGWIKKGDKAYFLREDPAQAAASAEAYKKAVSMAPDRSEPHWKLAMALCWLGYIAPDNRKTSIYGRAVEHGKKAVELAPDQAPPHYWLGVSYSLYGQAKGVMSSLTLVDPARKEMAEVVKIDPGYEQGGAYRVLGRVFHRLPGILGGDNEKAIDSLQKAIRLGPRNRLNYLYLAEVFFDEDRKKEASELLIRVLNDPCRPDEGPLCALAKEEALNVGKSMK